MQSIERNYGYDLRGARTSFTLYVDGNLAINTTYRYDSLGRLAYVYENGVRKAAYEYNNRHQLTRTTISSDRGSGRSSDLLRAEKTYTPGGQISRLTNTRIAGGQVLSRFDYNYDTRGFIMGVEAQYIGISGITTRFAYDDLGRLINEHKTQSGNVLIDDHFFFDNFSNRQSRQRHAELFGNEFYIFDDNNRMVMSTSFRGIRSSHAFDENGNETSRTSEGTSIFNTRDFMAYDGFNRLISVDKACDESDWPTARVQIEYTYRPDGMRSTKTVDGVTTQHIWDGANIVMDITEDLDGTRTETVYIRGLQLIAAVETTVLEDDSRTVRTVYYLHDGRGSVAQTVNSNGIVEQTYVYAAFGELLSEHDGDTNPFRHNGEYWDASTEMYYLRHRFYNPATGRFITPDPYWHVGNMIFWGGTTPNIQAIMQSSNLYVFVMHNPIRFTDPLGLWGKDDHELLTRNALTRLGDQHGLTGMLNYHATFIVAGNRYIDDSHGAANFGPGFGERQSRHFDRSGAGEVDTRIEWGEHYLDLAINIWMNANIHYAVGMIDNEQRYEERTRALFYLGRGLHSIQDIGAHLQFGVGESSVPVHRVEGESLLDAINNPIFDNPRYNVWQDSAGNWQSRDSGAAYGSVRWATSEVATMNYLNRFYEGILLW